MSRELISIKKYKSDMALQSHFANVNEFAERSKMVKAILGDENFQMYMRFLESMATTKLDKSAKCVSGRTVAYRTEINSDVNESKKFVSEKRNVRRHKIDPLENIDLKMQNIL